MTAAERLVGPLTKIERAKQHIVELNAVVQVFIDSKPYSSVTEHDPQTAQYVRRITKVEAVTPNVATVLGDILVNLRSALDHLAYQLIVVGAGASGHILTTKE